MKKENAINQTYIYTATKVLVKKNVEILTY